MSRFHSIRPRFHQAMTNSTAGINVTKAWQNYTGVGVKIGIIDDGIDYNHPDLNKNYLFNLDYDARDRDLDSYASTVDDKHGTTVAGIAAGYAEQGTIEGIAPSANLVFVCYRSDVPVGGGARRCPLRGRRPLAR